MNLDQMLRQINPSDQTAMAQCQARWNRVAHPLHSLGKLEEYLIKIAGIIGSPQLDLSRKALVVMCADNGVVAEGVTQTGQEVTAQVAENFLKMECSAAIMSKVVGADVFAIDIGVYRDTNIIQKKIAYGTKNMTKTRAMTREQTKRAIMVGIDQVRELKEQDYQIIATGEMGIGNTTTSSAVASVLLQQPVARMTGRGAGLNDEGLDRKITAIQTAIDLHHPDQNDVVEVLSCVGGLDIAGLVGVFLGGAIHQIPVVIDGFISSVACLCAARLAPQTLQYVLPSHCSKEPASQLILQALGLDHALNLEMHLGEGTGAIALFPLLDLSLAVYNQMSTFEDVQIDAYEELS